jgi:dihydropteroate synthase
MNETDTENRQEQFSIDKSSHQPSAEAVSSPGEAESLTLKIRNHEFVFGQRTYIMGIVNVTPDSFSGDGILDVDTVVKHALSQIEQGADIIDIGGQSTRPGHTPIDSPTEIERVIPVITKLRSRTDAVISIDTSSPDVLAAALAVGADILNSVWGLTDALMEVVARKGVPTVIMHNKDSANYEGDAVEEVVSSLCESANRACAAGLIPAQIILDPGIGFAKTADQNLALLSSFEKIKGLGFPTLIGTSRKSLIGKLTGLPPDKRVFGTAATVALAIAKGADIVRVHDVRVMRDVAKVSDAISRNWRPAHWQDS